jgi:putative heme-binding domain-containing protein
MSAQRIPLLILTVLAAAQDIPAQSAADIENGKQLFLACSRCHGLEGGGGEGPNLNRPATRARDDQALLAIIRDGIPDRGMPGFRQFTNGELHALVSYVHSLSRTGETATTGSADKGKLVYNRLDCSGCHIVAGEGGILGPELTHVGALRATAYLREAILDPGAALPRGVTQVLGRGFNEFLPVRVVTRDGREVRGLRVNEDSFTIQIRDAGARLYSFRKADLRELNKELGASLMPDYKNKVSPSELDDLVAYLSSLGDAK